MEHLIADSFGTCVICGWTEIHDPACDLHECEDCGAHGEHHCVVACDRVDCLACAALDENVRRLEAPEPADTYDSAHAMKLETRLVDEDRCGWKPRRR